MDNVAPDPLGRKLGDGSYFGRLDKISPKEDYKFIPDTDPLKNDFIKPPYRDILDFIPPKKDDDSGEIIKQFFNLADGSGKGNDKVYTSPKIIYTIIPPKK